MEKLVSNEEILGKALELVKEIKNDKEYREYITLRDKVKSNKEIMERIDNIKTLQKQYIKSAYLDDEIKAKLDKELSELEDIPLYKEYLLKEKKINNILISIKEGINSSFDNILNEEKSMNFVN